MTIKTINIIKTSIMVGFVMMLMLLFSRTLLSQQYADTTGFTRIENFIYVHQVDSITHKNSSYIFVLAESSDAKALAWKCSDDGLNIMYVFGKSLNTMPNGSVPTMFKFDAGDLSPLSYWDGSKTHRAAYIPMPLVSPFTEYAKRSNIVMVGVTDALTKETIVSAFRMQGFLRALPLLNNCR